MKNWKTAVRMLSAAALACLAACSNNGGGSSGEPTRGDGGASSGDDGGVSSEGSTRRSDSGSETDSGRESGSDSGPRTCEVDNTGNYFVCAPGQTGYYCVESDTPVQDGLAHACSQPTPDQTGLGSDYCCQ